MFHYLYQSDYGPSLKWMLFGQIEPSEWIELGDPTD